MQVMDKNGKTKKFLVEIKPSSQCKPPKKGKNEKKFLNEVKTYGINQAKWRAAKAAAKKNGYEFVVLTENDLGIH